jgi:hypothetical protein
MSMLPENQKELESDVTGVKMIMDRVWEGALGGEYRSARGELYYLSDLMLYLVYLLQEDEAGRIAEGFNEWIDKWYKEKSKRLQMQFKR